ncbi:MAG TPA: polyamine aminopropyltransferase [Candidatus Hydrothermia bacterium]|nr:polyamine aminopropyltransferase [Candidatus Hydrothermia bacterium]HRD22368.1 polyamine aminopropyltransferase [Candidatus Hydrothermia bacterium]
MELWFKELHDAASGITFKIKEYLYSGKSPFQKIDVFEVETYGRVLVLDGMVMLTERDEFIYHEMICHPALRVVHPDPEKILIIGGGDGGTVREVMKYSEVKKVTLVEIDKEVVEVSKRYLHNISGALLDPRLEIRFEDGVHFVKHSEDKFDIILLDTSDPVGPAVSLYRKEFYENCKNRLAQNGILVTQAESPWAQLTTLKNLLSEIKGLFHKTTLYLSHIPTYPGGIWAFLMMGENYDINKIQRPLPPGTKYYNDDVHIGMTALPQYLKEALDGNY